MPKLRFTFPQPPKGAVYMLDFQEQGINLGGDEWTAIHHAIAQSSYEAVVGYKRDVRFRVRLKSADGVISRWPRYQTISVERQNPAPVPAPSNMDVTVVGNTFVLRPKVEAAQTVEVEEKYDVEVRSGAEEPVDSVPYSHEGLLADPPRTPYGRDVAVPVCPGATDQWLHARLRRRGDGKPGPWLSIEHPAPPLGDYRELEDDDTAFSGGTIEQTDGIDRLEVDTGTLQLAPAPLDNSTTVLDDAEIPDNLGEFWPSGYYQTANLVHDQVVDFEPVVCPDVGTLVRTAVLDDDNVQVPIPIAAEDEDPLDTRRLELLDTDTTHSEPPRFEVEQSLSQDGSAWDAFERWVPGRVVVAKGIRFRVHLSSRLPMQIPVPDVWIRRRRRNRKWEFSVPFAYPTTPGLIEYTFDPVPDMMSEASLVATATVKHTSAIDARYLVVVESLNATSITVRVEQVVSEDEVFDGGGALTWTYPAAFFTGLKPIVTNGGGGAVLFAASPTATQAQLTGSAGDEVHLVARGVPPIANRVLQLHLKGF